MIAMDSSERRPVRILWGSFSDTVLTLAGSRAELDSACHGKNLEVIHWCHGRHLENTLHYLFPLRYENSPDMDLGEWVTRFGNRFPELADPEEVVSYVADNFNLLCDCFQPDVFVSWNRYDPVFGLPYQLAKERGIPTFDLERALIPHLISLGLEFRQEPIDFSAEHLARGKELLSKHPSGHIRKQRRPHVSFAGKGKGVLLVLGSWDAVTDREVQLYRNSHDMAVRMAESLPGWKVIYKPHPLAPLVEKSCPNLEISAANPVGLINKCDAVIANGTKLELDVIQNGKPLILSGGGFLSNSQAVRFVTTHKAAIEAVQSIDRWHDPDRALDALAAFVGSKAAGSWFSLSNAGNGAQPLDSLLDRFIEPVGEIAEKPGLESCLYKYHAASMNRYHRSGAGDIANWELLKELVKRVKTKLRLSI